MCLFLFMMCVLLAQQFDSSLVLTKPFCCDNFIERHSKLTRVAHAHASDCTCQTNVGSGKMAEGRKGGPGVSAEEILNDAVNFFMGEEFQGSVDKFVSDNCSLFSECDHYLEDQMGGVDLDHAPIREHVHEHMESFAKFQELFDNLMENFLQDKACNKRQFLNICREAYEDSESGKENIGSIFVELLMATTEYESFCCMMAHEAKNQKERGYASNPPGKTKK